MYTVSILLVFVGLFPFKYKQCKEVQSRVRVLKIFNFAKSITIDYNSKYKLA